jgi:hypothetical protein
MTRSTTTDADADPDADVALVDTARLGWTPAPRLLVRLRMGSESVLRWPRAWSHFLKK